VERPALAIALQDRDTRSLGIGRIVLNHARRWQAGEDVTHDDVVGGEFLVSVE